MRRRAAWLIAALWWLAACEDAAQYVRDHPDDMERLGQGEEQVLERRF